MKFEKPAEDNPIDQGRVVGQPHDRIDGPLKTTGTARYAYERNDAVPRYAYGYPVASAIARGKIASIDSRAARRMPGVLAVVTAQDVGDLAKGTYNIAKLFGGMEIDHYHQAVAIVVARTFEQARAAAAELKVDYIRAKGRFDLAQAKNDGATKPPSGPRGAGVSLSDFEAAFAVAPVQVDAIFSTPDQAHAAMEPHASIAAWNGDQLTLWTSNQMIDWGRSDVARTLGLPKEKVRLISPYVGGGFGGKLFVRADAILAALGARMARQPVKVTLPRPMIFNNTTHRPATIQRLRLGAGKDGKLLAIGHEGWSGNLPNGKPENAVQQTQFLYAGAVRMTALQLAELDLPEGNAMRAPGEASGHLALEVAMDELAEKLGMDPVDLRIVNDTQVDPLHPERPFSQRHLVQCLKTGAERFGWAKRDPKPASRREGDWLIGMGMAAGFRNSPVIKSGARVRLDQWGIVTVETDMTDIGTGSYTIIAQTAAEMLGLPLERVKVRLGDSSFPVSSGSGGQFGANSSTSGVYAACVKLRQAVLERLEISDRDAQFKDGQVMAGGRNYMLGDAAADAELVAEDSIEFGDLGKKFQISTFVAHFVEVGVDVHTAEVRLRRMLAVCDAGRILNPKSARSQVIGAMTMGAGAALMEELAVDKRLGFFVNHDLAGYEVPVHADIPRQEVIFIEGVDAASSPMKAKGIGELGLCGVGAAIANAIYNATGVRVRDYPITLDKLLAKMPLAA
ncbi:aldehyde oxidoreductase molybdenum-binding subunit PaoC [Bordetella sp. LUAb4]|uniref:aldehyde oxidoreductase molybdenum-binding subunit PaoC n=1 Tax=Bordetella sp. LUAb4 TaxID=2843195 RepID=UPI001E44AACD|nr:aldehyde oxidoreductase molybdenum-binding subunit PaoC [Bordetella sp. LUAb4]